MIELILSGAIIGAIFGLAGYFMFGSNSLSQ